MRPEFWRTDQIRIELEDRDVAVRIVHGRTLAAVTIEFRLPVQLPDVTLIELRERVEFLAQDNIRDLASFFDRF